MRCNMRRSNQGISILDAWAAIVSGLAISAGSSAASPGVHIKANEIGGVVSSARGPEAGVWVIAETSDLPTRFAKIVVTDDQGRYLIPDLPGANYTVWVRGYGLVDSARVHATQGSTVNLAALVAPSAASAAQIYPAAYWYAMMKLPN